jgi:Tfp pilus assembly protein PilX
MTMRRIRNQQGATLIVAVVMVGVLAVISAALVRRVAVEMESASAKRHYDVSVSCADGARELLISSFRTFGVLPTSLTLNQVVGERRYASGHYDTFGVTSVEPVGAEQFASAAESAMDISNRAARSRLGGAFYRITVVCSDKNQPTRQSEIEFLVRFGL